MMKFAVARASGHIAKCTLSSSSLSRTAWKRCSAKNGIEGAVTRASVCKTYRSVANAQRLSAKADFSASDARRGEAESGDVPLDTAEDSAGSCNDAGGVEKSAALKRSRLLRKYHTDRSSINSAIGLVAVSSRYASNSFVTS